MIRLPCGLTCELFRPCPENTHAQGYGSKFIWAASKLYNHSGRLKLVNAKDTAIRNGGLWLASKTLGVELHGPRSGQCTVTSLNILGRRPSSYLHLHHRQRFSASTAFGGHLRKVQAELWLNGRGVSTAIDWTAQRASVDGDVMSGPSWQVPDRRTGNLAGKCTIFPPRSRASDIIV